MSKKIYKYIDVVNKGKELKEWASAFEDGTENVVQWLGNMNQIVSGKVNELGLSWDDEKQEIYLEGDVKTVLEQCDKFFDTIFDAYENGGKIWDELGLGRDDDAILDAYENGGKIWDELGLGGDDDVDYNSTYPSTVIAVLKEM